MGGEGHYESGLGVMMWGVVVRKHVPGKVVRLDIYKTTPSMDLAEYTIVLYSEDYNYV